MKTNAVLIGAGIAILLLGFFFGRYSSKDKSLAPTALPRLEALTKANELAAATSALLLLEQGDTDDVRAILKGQVRSSLATLHTLQLGDLPPVDAAIVNDALSKGDEYAKKHGM